jgi:hypothetical protein
VLCVIVDASAWETSRIGDPVRSLPAKKHSTA